MGGEEMPQFPEPGEQGEKEFHPPPNTRNNMGGRGDAPVPRAGGWGEKDPHPPQLEDGGQPGPNSARSLRGPSRRPSQPEEGGRSGSWAALHPRGPYCAR
jgi:hypothetical protein